MSKVHVSLHRDAAHGKAPITGPMRFAPSKRRPDGQDIILPAGFDVDLVDGEAIVELDATGPDWCWIAYEPTLRGAIRSFLVPEAGDDEVLEYEGLTDVDPSTLEPSPEALAGWTATLDEVREIRDDVVATIPLMESTTAAAEAAQDAAAQALAARDAAQGHADDAHEAAQAAQAAASGADGLTGADGDDGREVELQTSATHVQWRYVGDVTWTDLIALSAITGPAGADGAAGVDGDDGLSVELQTTATHIQWRLVGGTWADLVALSTITGPAGADGEDGAAGADGADGEDLTHATPQTINPQTGTTYELVAGDAGKLVTCTNEAAITVTVPDATFTAGQRVDMAVLGEGMVTLVGSSITLNPEAGLSLVSRAQYSAFTIYFLDATTAFVTGSMAAA